jgi:hypothetical protein
MRGGGGGGGGGGDGAARAAYALCPTVLRLHALKGQKVIVSRKVHRDTADEAAITETVVDTTMVHMLGYLQAPDCGFNITMATNRLNVEGNQDRALRYALMITAVTVVQIIVITRQVYVRFGGRWALASKTGSALSTSCLPPCPNPARVWVSGQVKCCVG